MNIRMPAAPQRELSEPETDPDAFTQLFSEFTETAYRLEVRRSYGVTDEDAPFQQYLAGEDPGIRWLQPWLDLMSEQTRRGKQVHRVRVVDDPPSDYLRWEIENTPHNLRAGEDIRYLPRREAERLDLPDHDSWLFDDRLLALLEFDDEDRFLGFRRSRDTNWVSAHVRWRELAWARALPFDRYVAEELRV